VRTTATAHTNNDVFACVVDVVRCVVADADTHNTRRRRRPQTLVDVFVRLRVVVWSTH
jgi:hypothetical protein